MKIITIQFQRISSITLNKLKNILKVNKNVGFYFITLINAVAIIKYLWNQ